MRILADASAHVRCQEWLGKTYLCLPLAAPPRFSQNLSCKILPALWRLFAQRCGLRELRAGRMFNLGNGREKRFLIQGRVFTAEEQAQLGGS